MSTIITTQIWAMRGIPTITKMILVKLGDNANDAGVCWPSIPRVAIDCEVDERTVQRAIAWAESKGIIRREMRPGRSTIYHLTPGNMPPPAICRPGIVPPQPPAICHPTPGNGSITHIEPSNEPSIEPSYIRPLQPETEIPDLDESNLCLEGEDRSELTEALAAWNQLAAQLGLTLARKLNGQRIPKLRARLRESGGLAGWRKAMVEIRSTSWLHDGSARGGWRADFDFVLQQKSFTKLIEGAYGKAADCQRGDGFSASARPDSGAAPHATKAPNLQPPLPPEILERLRRHPSLKSAIPLWFEGKTRFDLQAGTIAVATPFQAQQLEAIHGAALASVFGKHLEIIVQPQPP